MSTTTTTTDVMMWKKSFAFHYRQLKQLLARDIYWIINRVYRLSSGLSADTSAATFQQELVLMDQWDEQTWSEMLSHIIGTGNKSLPVIQNLVETVLIMQMSIVSFYREPRQANSIVPKLRIPTAESFVKQCILHCARQFYLLPFLLVDMRVSGSQFITYYNLSIAEAERAIETTVDFFLPLASLYKETRIREPTKWFLTAAPQKPASVPLQKPAQQPLTNTESRPQPPPTTSGSRPPPPPPPKKTIVEDWHSDEDGGGEEEDEESLFYNKQDDYIEEDEFEESTSAINDDELSKFLKSKSSPKMETTTTTPKTEIITQPPQQPVKNLIDV